MNKNRILVAILAPLFLLFYSCGTKLLSSSSSPATRATVVGVSADYLTKVVQGKLKEVNVMIVWAEYLENSSPGMTKKKYFSQLESIQNRWQPSEHPLLGLTTVSVDVDGNDAEVVLRKEQQEPDISVSLAWAGTGWMIVGDSLFGDRGLISRQQYTNR